MNFMLGCDPEMFLVDAAGSLVSSIGKIGGSKQEPRPLPIAPGFAVQEDNVAIEFNIPPAASDEEFEAKVRLATNFIRNNILSEIGLDVVNLSAASFPKEQLKDPAAKEFGCDPDYNAWTGKRNPRPKASDKTLRSCGGHLHIGTDLFQSPEDVREFIKHCDLFLGVPSVLMDNGELRKKLYGKAGAFRYKPYGCEYRSLSNFWVFDPKYTKWAYRQVQRALNSWQQHDIAVHPSIADCINNNDKAVAMHMVNTYQLEVV